MCWCLFQMDEDREAATGAISHLMPDAEVPAWVTQDAASEQVSLYLPAFIGLPNKTTDEIQQGRNSLAFLQ